MGTTQVVKQHKAERYDVATDRADNSRYVYMSNAVARAAQGLSLAEKRIIMTAASRLDSRRVPAPGAAPGV